MTPPSSRRGRTPAARPRCRDCGARIRFARHHDTGKWVPLDAEPVPAGTQAATGAWVLIGQQAWRMGPLISHFQAVYEATEPAARDLAAGYPHHQSHTCTGGAP